VRARAVHPTRYQLIIVQVIDNNKKASVIYDPHTRESRGIGFVTPYPHTRKVPYYGPLKHNDRESVFSILVFYYRVLILTINNLSGERYYDSRP
jgi:hypothetical protein